MINKNQQIKVLQREVCQLKSQHKENKERNSQYRNKYKTELVKQQEKFSNVVDNLKNRINRLTPKTPKNYDFKIINCFKVYFCSIYNQ